MQTLAPSAGACGTFLLRRSAHPAGVFLIHGNKFSYESKKTGGQKPPAFIIF